MKKHKLQCPNGHTEDLLIRIVIDAPIVLVEDSDGEAHLEAGEDRSKWDDNPENSGSMVGTNGGVWCPACDEWYDEEDCIT